jgi:hypothetical protein
MDSGIGFLRYEADYIENGIFDARKSAQALLGFDELMKYFIKKEASELSNVDFSLPVKIREGSWEVLIPDNVADIVKLVQGTALGVYLLQIAKKAATDGLLETGPIKDVKKIFQWALKAIQWCIKVRKHSKGGKITEILDRSTDSVVLDVEGEQLVVPIEIYLIYQHLPTGIFSKVSSVIDDKTEMVLGVKDENSIFLLKEQ